MMKEVQDRQGGGEEEKLFVMADIGPIRDGATANYSVSWSLCAALDEQIGVLATRRGHRNIDPRRFQIGLKSKVWVYLDCFKLGLRNFSEDLRAVLDTLVWLTQAIGARRRLRKAKCDRLLIIGSNHWGCLIPGLILGKISGIRTEVFLMDDLEASARMRNRRLQARIARLVEKMVLHRFDRVWTISRGYSEHLTKKYGETVRTSLLPLPIRGSKVTYRPHAGEQKVIGYSGSTHGLYEQPLRNLVSLLDDRNQRAGSTLWKLRIYTASKVDGLAETLGDKSGIIENLTGLNNKDLLEELGKSYANFLPYTFDDEHKLMVSTAFSCKTSEFLLSGRPIMIYGPTYGSVPRHFLTKEIPCVRNDEGELELLLKDVAQHDGPELVEHYQKLLDEFHAPEAIRKILATPLAESSPSV